MALPKVTPGTYDYGQYAKPTMVKYRGGQEQLAAGIAQGIAEYGQAVKQKKKKEKDAEEWKTNTKFQLLSQVDPTILAKNEQQIKSLTDQMGELGRLKQLGKIPGEEYTEKMVNLNNTFNSYKLLNSIYQDMPEDELDLTQFKGGEELDRNAGFMRAVSSGTLETDFDAETGKSTASWTGASGKKFVVDLNEVTHNVKDYMKLDQKFDFRDADKQDILQKVANQVNASKDIRQYMTDIGESASGKFEMLNTELATKGISQSNFIDGFVDKYGKDIFEDVVKPSYETATGQEIGFDHTSPEAQQMIREVVAGQVASKVQQTGNAISDPKPEGDKRTPSQIEYEKELAYFNDNSKETHLNKIKMLRTLLEDNKNYKYKVKQGKGTIIGYDEVEGELVPYVEQEFNLNDPYAVSKVLAKIKYGTNSSYASRLVSDITKTQVENPADQIASPDTPAPAGFEQGMFTEAKFSIDGRDYSLQSDAIESEKVSVSEAAQQLRISETIPQALKDKGLPVTIDNVNVIRDIAKRSKKTINEIIAEIPKPTMGTQEVVLTAKPALPGQK